MSEVKLYLGDCLEIMKELEDGSVDAVIADPPYGMNNNNNYGRFTKGPNSHGNPASRTYPPTIGDDGPFDPSPCLDFDKVIFGDLIILPHAFRLELLLYGSRETQPLSVHSCLMVKLRG